MIVKRNELRFVWSTINYIYDVLLIVNGGFLKLNNLFEVKASLGGFIGAINNFPKAWKYLNAAHTSFGDIILRNPTAIYKFNFNIRTIIKRDRGLGVRISQFNDRFIGTNFRAHIPKIFTRLYPSPFYIFFLIFIKRIKMFMADYFYLRLFKTRKVPIKFITHNERL